MYDLGNFVLKQALTDAVEFRKSNPDFFINVNMSAKQLERKTFCGVVMALLKETGFPAGQLCLELTERCRSMPVSVMEEKLLYLKQHGVRLAMDDYGTGSASSSVLLQTPMDEIKIDMSFIRGITDNQTKQALVRSMVDFANKADLKSCLEGVEDEKLQNYLRSFGATWFQLKGLLKPGDHVLVTAMEHNAVMRPLVQLEKHGISFDRIPCASDGSLLLDKATALLRPETKLALVFFRNSSSIF